MITRNYVSLCFLLFASLLSAQQLLEFVPISSNTVLLRLDEGEKDLSNFSEYYIYDAPNATYFGQIDESEALLVTNYSIQSAEDPNYNAPQQPQNIYYKAKEEKGLFEYFIYIELPTTILNGATYTITTANLNTEESYTFTADIFNYTSPAIHVNQIGMLPDAPKKYAYISQWLGKSSTSSSNDQDYTMLEGATGYVIRVSDGAIIYEGSGNQGLQFKQGITESGFDYSLANQFWTMARTWQFDFSEVGTVIPVYNDEEYKIIIEGIGSSAPFRIAVDAYDGLVKLLASGLYHQRSGIEREAPYSNLPKPIDHYPGVDGFEITYSNYRRLDNEGGDAESFVQLPAQATSFINPTSAPSWMGSPDDLPWGSGGHFDAGDHDIYTEHLAIPIFGSFAYLLAPDGFIDGQFNIPENTNGLPDILDEIKWTLDFFKRTKGPTNGVCGGKETDNYYGPSWNDGSGNSSTEQMWFVYKEDPFTTFIYAAAAAQFALALQEAGDPTGEAQLYIDEAIAAYNWATQNQVEEDQVIQIQGFPTIGYFPDGAIMASAMLYAVTGSQEFLDYYVANTQINSETDQLYVFEAYDQQFATWAFTLIPPDKWDNFENVIDLQNTQIQATINWANTWGINDQESFPYRNIMSRFAPPNGGNTGSTPQVFPQIMAYHHTEEEDILGAILSSNDMNLGGNSENRVYITGSEIIGAERASSDILHNDNFEYGGENIPGIPLYGLWTTASYYFQSSPPAEEWPHYETHTNSRIYLGHTEFTVHQNSIICLATYGYLNSILNPDASTLSITDSGEIPVEKKLDVFPNPSNGTFTIRWQDVDEDPTFRLYDLSGREIEMEYTFAKAQQKTIKSNCLSDGVYILEATMKEGQLTVKILVRE